MSMYKALTTWWLVFRWGIPFVLLLALLTWASRWIDETLFRAAGGGVEELPFTHILIRVLIEQEFQ